MHNKVKKYLAAGGTLEQALDLLYQGCNKDTEKQAVMKHLMKGFAQDEEDVGKESSPASMTDSVFERIGKSSQEDAPSNITPEKQPAHHLNKLVSWMAQLCAGEIGEEVDDFVAHVRYLASKKKILLAMIGRVLSEFEYPAGADFEREIFQRAASRFEEEMQNWIKNCAKLKDRGNGQFVLRVAIIKSFVSANIEVEYPILESLIGFLSSPDDLKDVKRASAYLDENCAIIDSIRMRIFSAFSVLTSVDASCLG